MSDATGNGDKVSAFVNHLGFIALQRFVTIIGIPVAGWLFLQVWGGIDALKEVSIKLRLDVMEMKGDMKVLQLSDDSIKDRLKSLERHNRNDNR